MALLGVVKLVALVFLAVFSASLHQQVGVGESSSSHLALVYLYGSTSTGFFVHHFFITAGNSLV